MYINFWYPVGRTEDVTDKPANGVPSIDTKEGLAKCWG